MAAGEKSERMGKCIRLYSLLIVYGLCMYILTVYCIIDLKFFGLKMEKNKRLKIILVLTISKTRKPQRKRTVYSLRAFK